MKNIVVLMACLVSVLFIGGCDSGKSLDMNTNDMFVVDIERQVKGEIDSSLYIIAGEVSVNREERLIKIKNLRSIAGVKSFTTMRYSVPEVILTNNKEMIIPIPADTEYYVYISKKYKKERGVARDISETYVFPVTQVKK